MNRRSARNRHRRMAPPDSGATGIVAPSFNREWYAEQHRRLEEERLRRIGDRRDKPRSSRLTAALLALASLGGGR